MNSQIINDEVPPLRASRLENSGSTPVGTSDCLNATTERSSRRTESAISEADRPTNVLFFDGVCGLCNHFVNFVLSRDRRATIRFAPLQGETSSRWDVSQKGTLEEQNSQASVTLPSSSRLAAPHFDTVVWLDHEGRAFVRSAAAIRVLWQLGGFWKFVGVLLWLIPRPLRDVGYRCVSASRYRLFGKKETCRLPTPNERSRFLP